MNYLIFASQELAQSRNHQEAVDSGCSEASTTKYWWVGIEHDDGRFALLIPDTDTAGLTESEQSDLKTFAEIDAGEWFPEAET